MFRSYMVRNQKPLLQMIDESIEILKDQPGFDLTFLKGVRPFHNFYSQAQYEGVLRVYERWNIELKIYNKNQK